MGRKQVIDETGSRAAMHDPSNPGYADEIRHQCLLVRDDPREKEILDWIEAVMDTEGWRRDGEL